MTKFSVHDFVMLLRCILSTDVAIIAPACVAYLAKLLSYVELDNSS